MKEIQNDIFLQLRGAFLYSTDKEAVAPFIIEQDCDQPFCGDIEKYSCNIARQAFSCNIHFAYDNCCASNTLSINNML